MDFAFIPTHSLADVYKTFDFFQYIDFKNNPIYSAYDNLHNFARQSYERFENGKYVPRSPIEYQHLPFLIFVEHDQSPIDNSILDMVDPNRRKYAYLFSIRIEPRDKRRKNGNVKEITITVQVSNIGHVGGEDPNTLFSLPDYIPTAFASFFDCIINKESSATAVKYYYKFDERKHLDEMLYWSLGNEIVQIHETEKPNDRLSIKTLYGHFYGGSDDNIKAKQTEMKQVLKQ